jgi:hypothetical protein
MLKCICPEILAALLPEASAPLRTNMASYTLLFSLPLTTRSIDTMDGWSASVESTSGTARRVSSSLAQSAFITFSSDVNLFPSGSILCISY